MNDWSVVRIFGSNCLRAVAALEEAGAVMYCPVVKVHKRLGRLRSATVVVSTPAYQGWAFMQKEPEPRLVAPWLRYRALELKIGGDEIDRIRADEAEWNLNAAKVVVYKKRELWEKGTIVQVISGLMKGEKMMVEKDLGDRAYVNFIGRNISTKLSLFTLFLEKVGA